VTDLVNLPDDDAVDDAFVLLRWMHELADPTPNAAVIASLEDVAEERGWHPYDALQAITAGKFSSKIRKAVGGWDPDLHPRGKDGTFIEKGGDVRLEGQIAGPDGKQVDATGMRGKVTEIIPDKANPGHPTIRVQVKAPNGKAATIDVKPESVTAAPEKARLDRPAGEKPGGGLAQQGNRRFTQKAEPGRPPERDDFGGEQPSYRSKPTETPEQENRRLAGEEARGATDAELARQVELGPEVWRQAVAKEQEKRAARRAQDEERRQKLIADINAEAALLSTTDAEERARGLDKLLVAPRPGYPNGLRFAPIDTDKVHDHIYPPDESGDWTPERAAQHEQMWDDLLSQIEAANIPKEHDALVLGGLPGAGKSYMLKPGEKADSFGVVSWEPNGELPPGATHVSINPDIVKEMLIARGMLPEGISQDLKPMEQVTFLHEESSAVAKMFSARLGRLGYNVVLDNTMDSEGGMLKRMTPLARQGYKFRGLFADIPPDESLESARKRYLDAALTPMGGRYVPSSVQGNRSSSKGNMSKNRDAMDSLVADDWFTEFMIVDNTGVSTRNPKGDVVAQGAGAGSAADRYLPGNDAAAPKAGPRLPTPPEPPPTITPPAAPAAPAAVPVA
jgi:hypothetical protein